MDKIIEVYFETYCVYVKYQGRMGKPYYVKYTHEEYRRLSNFRADC